MKNEKKYLILGLVVSILILMGASYAYFTTRIEGNRKDITIDMSELKIIFTNGDAIEASDVYAEDNLDIIKTFSVENKTKNEYKYNIVIEDLVNTFKTTGYLVYKITSDDGGYNMTEFADVPKSLSAEDVVLAYNVNVPAKSIHNYNIEIKYINSETVDQSADQGATLSGKLYISKGSYPNLLTTILKDNPTISERTDFSVTNTETTTGTLYKTNKTEDGSDVYYYSGNTINNWVKFGKETRTSCTYNGVEVMYISDFDNVQVKSSNLTESECTSTNVCNMNNQYYYVGLTEAQCTTDENGPKGTWISSKATYNGSSEIDIYWRIIRTNEDGSVRMLYSGLDPATTEGYIGKSLFNSTYNDPMYVGYMYGTSGSLENNRTNTNDSTIKMYIDNWYEDILLTNYDKYLSKTAIYCNDRSVPNNDYSTSSSFNYGAYTRLSNYTPTYKCGGNGTDGLFESTQATADKFSASTTGGGNGQLKYPIALMTADELAFAGGLKWTNLSSPYAWYYTNSQGESITGSGWWWSLSPFDWRGSFAYVWDVDGSGDPGYLNNDDVYGSGAVRPQVSLASCVGIKSGNGTPESAYEIDENSCS